MKGVRYSEEFKAEAIKQVTERGFGAVTYSAFGSFFPGVGNLVGGPIGFTVGVFAALGIEKVIYEPTEIRNKLKGI
jgi:hypothetical protein